MKSSRRQSAIVLPFRRAPAPVAPPRQRKQAVGGTVDNAKAAERVEKILSLTRRFLVEWQGSEARSGSRSRSSTQKWEFREFFQWFEAWCLIEAGEKRESCRDDRGQEHAHCWIKPVEFGRALTALGCGTVVERVSRKDGTRGKNTYRTLPDMAVSASDVA